MVSAIKIGKGAFKYTRFKMDVRQTLTRKVLLVAADFFSFSLVHFTFGYGCEQIVFGTVNY